MVDLSWGGYSNGRIPPTELTEVENFAPISGTHSSTTVLSNLLRADAAKQCRALQEAFRARFSKSLDVSEAYRTIYTQQAYKDDENRGTGATAATPGTSIHGWALAVDFGSGVATFGSPEKVWMDENAPKYGYNPRGNDFNEAWHFEFTLTPTIISAGVGTPTPIEDDDDMPLSDADIAKIKTAVLSDTRMKTLFNQSQNSAERTAALVTAVADLPKAVWSFLLANKSSASANLRLIYKAVVK